MAHPCNFPNVVSGLQESVSLFSSPFPCLDQETGDICPLVTFTRVKFPHCDILQFKRMGKERATRPESQCVTAVTFRHGNRSSPEIVFDAVSHPSRCPTLRGVPPVAVHLVGTFTALVLCLAEYFPFYFENGSLLSFPTPLLPALVRLLTLVVVCLPPDRPHLRTTAWSFNSRRLPCSGAHRQFIIFAPSSDSLKCSIPHVSRQSIVREMSRERRTSPTAVTTLLL